MGDKIFAVDKKEESVVRSLWTKLGPFHSSPALQLLRQNLNHGGHGGHGVDREILWAEN